MNITKPTLLVDKEKTIRNIRRMRTKVKQCGGICFRPHFKTHQSAEIGEWFRQEGVKVITVSSLDMGFYFARHGWNNIDVAVLVNPNAIHEINLLAKKVDQLHLLVDTPEIARFLDQNLEKNTNLWIKINTAYHRTGVDWQRKNDVLAVAEILKKSPKITFKGLLTHSGHSYHATSKADIVRIYHETVRQMGEVRDFLAHEGINGLDISIGDTPTCSVMDTFFSVDEVRCGNFVFYDLMQLYLGACRQEDISIAVACPVIGRYPGREELVIHGGAVHLSKDSVTDAEGNNVFGLVAFPDPSGRGWAPALPDTYVSALSQEHGVIKTTPDVINRVKLGDLLMILPAHSCLTVNLMRNLHTLEGQKLTTLQSCGG